MVKELVLTVVVRKQGSRYSALCSELDVASDGDTVEQAKENLKEAVLLHVETILEVEGSEGLAERLGSSCSSHPCVVL
ncbi:MAG: type II toxin-antitoxin system HicB family antitoxin [Candidatus Woesearchaeota archaeon]|nr:type II toxin-antitoxin system HicB family antitoxin [Candidatus Woesearchaeota archaeon]